MATSASLSLSADQYIAVLESAFETLAKNEAMTYIVSQWGFLASGFGASIVSPILGWFLGIAVDWIVKSGVMGMFFYYTDFRVSAQGRDFVDAAIVNHAAIKVLTTTPEQRAAAKAKLIATARPFLKFNQ